MNEPVDHLIGSKVYAEWAPTKVVGLCSDEAYNDIKAILVTDDRHQYNYEPIFEFDKNGDWHLRLRITRKNP